MDIQMQETAEKFLDGRMAAGKIGGIYCFYGAEEYMLDHYIKKIQSRVDELDYFLFDGDNFDVDRFSDAVSSHPIASDFKLVVVRQIQLNSLEKKVKEEAVKSLMDITDIKDSICVIFKSGEFASSSDSRKTTKPKTSKKTRTSPKASDTELVDYLKENGILCEFRENTKQRLVRWIRKIAASEKLDISDANASYILSRAGRMMYPLRNELDKLIAYVKEENRHEIMERDIILLVADISEREIAAFELSNALTARDYTKAFEVLEKHKYKKDDPIMILGQISRCFSDMLAISLAMSGGLYERGIIAKKTGMHEFKVKLLSECVRSYKNPAQVIAECLELCRICDIRLKSTSLPPFQVLENLLYSFYAVTG